jgi:hypothetical protein
VRLIRRTGPLSQKFDIPRAQPMIQPNPSDLVRTDAFVPVQTAARLWQKPVMEDIPGYLRRYH